MNIVARAIVAELRERFGEHRISKHLVRGRGLAGLTINHKDNSYIYVCVRFIKQDSVLKVVLYLDHLYHNVNYELVDPRSIDDSFELIRRHLDRELDRKDYNNKFSNE